MVMVMIYEWSLEVVLNVLLHFYIRFFYGSYIVLDRITSIIFNFFMVSILPIFHLMSDNYYRTLVMEHGYCKALWKRLIDLNN